MDLSRDIDIDNLQESIEFQLYDTPTLMPHQHQSTFNFDSFVIDIGSDDEEPLPYSSPLVCSNPIKLEPPSYSFEHYAVSVSPANHIKKLFDTNRKTTSILEEELKSRKSRLPFTQLQKETLDRWIMQHSEHPYPTQNEINALAQKTGLNVKQIRTYFVNARTRGKVKQLYKPKRGDQRFVTSPFFGYISKP